tara:strand:- start:2649 stop:3635 length:987 start_codon:yes stop_codon:yes gene_type:complete
MTRLLDIKNLEVEFHAEKGLFRPVRGVSLTIEEGETLAVVGESGCGKSITALSVMRLLPMLPGRCLSGVIRFRGRNLFEASEDEMRKTRGNDIGMVFQEPMTSLNPILTIGDQIAEAIILHQKKSSKDARGLTIEMLGKVAIPSPESRIDQYPHELSGGMKQRVMIAMAISCYPALLIADEPTTALDVTIQAQILDLINSLRRKDRMAVMLITHNLGIVAEHADRVAVMYAGKIIEEAATRDLFENPTHPYTRGLLNSLPQAKVKERLEPIVGTVPDPANLPKGCAFHPRCPEANPRCRTETPELSMLRTDREPHRVACWISFEEVVK